MTTLGHFLVILMGVAGVLGAMLGMTWLRWQTDKRRPASYWRKQPP